MTTRQGGGGGLNLLDLPVDILALILTPLVVAQETIPLCPCAFHTAETYLPAGVCALLLVHPALHAIACPLLYTANVFELDLTGKHGNAVRRNLDDAATAAAQAERERVPGMSSGGGGGGGGGGGDSLYAALRRRDMGSLLLFTEPSARRRIRSLRVKLDRLRGWIDVSVVPVLADMVLHGSLSDLSITIHESIGGGHGGSKDTKRVRNQRGGDMGDASILARPPVAGLLRVLADPYLRSARLLVTATHGSVWCPFHDVTAPCSAAAVLSSGESAKREMLAASHGGLVEVDWQAIVREVLDPAGTELAVGWTADAAVRERGW
ncbi:hypothetical protein K4F52_003658 [Lecanicillium sp. MT-2017a]|nr:hypothetical protein K4F52_003658 [Lecanicillium sp. MT-2017a]